VAPILQSSRMNAVRVPLVVALIAVLAAGCGGTPTEPSVPFRQLRPLGLGGPFACQPGVRVVEDAGEWVSLSEGLHFAEPPVVDFGAERVVLISLGARPTSGYSVEVQGVRRSGSSVTMEAVELTVGRCPALAVITCPGAIVVLPRSRTSVDVEWAAARPRPGCE
jgi:hypothetical protein